MTKTTEQLYQDYLYARTAANVARSVVRDTVHAANVAHKLYLDSLKEEETVLPITDELRDLCETVING